MNVAALRLLAAAIVAQPLVNEDFLEPSVLNEVEHALTIAPTNAPPASIDWKPATNGLSRTAIALKLVTSQRSDGRWVVGTNDVTATARRMLERLAEESRESPSPPVR